MTVSAPETASISPPGIGLATEADIPGIVALQAANQSERGGMLTGGIPRERIAAWLGEMPQLVARRGSGVAGYLLTSARPAGTHEHSVVAAMLAAYPGRADAYVYGPICVAASERGQGVAQRLFQALCRQLPGREGVLFIRRDNPASLRAHARMGMHEVAGFSQGGLDYAVLAFVG